jgi:hypothetical protein
VPCAKLTTVNSTAAPATQPGSCWCRNAPWPCLALLTSLLPVSAPADTYAVYKSTDRARSWVRADSGLPSHVRVNALGIIDGVNLAGTDAGVFRSTDAAGNWRPTRFSDGTSVRVLDFATMGSQVFAASDGSGVLVSADGGANWNSTAGLTTGKVRCLLASRDALYAGLDEGGVRRSVDAGRSWQSLTNGLPAKAQVFALAAVEGQVFAGLYSQGLYGLDPVEMTWTRADTMKPLVLAASTDTLIAGHNPGGLHWSADRGRTWDGISKTTESLLRLTPRDLLDEPAAEAPVWALASGHGLTMAGAAAGTFFSEDGGRHWTRSRTGLPSQAPGIAFLVSDRMVLVSIPTTQAGVRALPPGGFLTLPPFANDSGTATRTSPPRSVRGRVEMRPPDA